MLSKFQIFVLFFSTFFNIVLLNSVSSIGTMSNKNKGPCECGVFEKGKVGKDPVMKQAPLNITCDDTANETCIKMCAALAEAARDRGPQLICASIGHINKLQVAIFARACDTKKWTFTNVSTTEDICCHQGAPVKCDENNNKL